MPAPPAHSPPVEDGPNFRPRLLKDYIGQEHAKAMLGLMLEDFDLMIPASKTGGTPTRLKLPRFTLITATTEPSQLLQPLQDRFGESITSRPYSQEELELIAERDAGRMGYLIDQFSRAQLPRY